MINNITSQYNLQADTNDPKNEGVIKIQFDMILFCNTKQKIGIFSAHSFYFSLFKGSTYSEHTFDKILTSQFSQRRNKQLAVHTTEVQNLTFTYRLVWEE